jgi:hypothetical protein
MVVHASEECMLHINVPVIDMPTKSAAWLSLLPTHQILTGDNPQ